MKGMITETTMLKARIFDLSLFFSSVAIAFSTGPILIDIEIYLKALLIYWLFSVAYFHLRIVTKSGKSSIDYGISYNTSFALFTGPLGVFIFETSYRFTVYLYKKWKKTDDPGEFLDTFYNIGAFSLTGSLLYYTYYQMNPYFANIPFGFWILIFLLVMLASAISTILLTIVFVILGELKSRQDILTFLLKDRSWYDTGKVALTNGLLLIFLVNEQWEILIILFLLNYIVSHSLILKSQNAQTKFERDKFEQMAYEDFLTGVHNRAYMDLKMSEMNQSNEQVAIVLADIDKFKKINDNYNHSVGDRVIQHFAKTLSSYLSPDDYIFRSGGEEFTLFLRYKTYEECTMLVQNILKGIETSHVKVEFDQKETTIAYTSSFGLYYLDNNYDEMKKGYILADQLLLQSKQLGRNRLSAENGVHLHHNTTP